MNTPLTAAVSGMAIAMPRAPPRLAPTVMPMRLMAGWMRTAERMTSGLTRLSVTFWATTQSTSVQSAMTGLVNSAMSVASAAEHMGPTTGMKCRMDVRMAMRPA